MAWKFDSDKKRNVGVSRDATTIVFEQLDIEALELFLHWMVVLERKTYWECLEDGSINSKEWFEVWKKLWGAVLRGREGFRPH